MASVTTLYESIDIERLDALLALDVFTKEERDQLEKYKKKYQPRVSAVKVDYQLRGLHLGRRYAKQSLSLQSLKKSIRETLVHDTHTDVDIKNCHLVLLSQYCKEKGVVCDCINDYVDNRVVRLQQLIDDHNITRKQAKELILVMMYGGSVTNYCISNAFDVNKPLPKWVNDLDNEMKKITTMICHMNKDIYDGVKKLKRDEYKNKDASTLSYVLQIIEDKVIMTALNFFILKSIPVETLCFDGLLVKSKNITSDLLEELSSYCKSGAGYKVEFEIKEMESHYTIGDYKTVKDFSDYAFDNLEKFDQQYMDALTDTDGPNNTYQLKKTYFEKFFCKIQEPEPIILFKNGQSSRPNMLTPASSAQLLKPVKSGRLGVMGNSIAFYDEWSSDVNHRYYSSCDFMPYNKTIQTDRSVYNLFEGFNPNIYGASITGKKRTKLITPYLDLVQELCGGNDEHALYFHKYIAHIFQYPDKRPPIAIIIKGKQGTGKNMVLDAIGNMLDGKHYITSSRPTDFFGEHAEGYYRKLLVNLNEAEGRDTFEFEGKMKSFITEDTLTMNAKYMRPITIKNHARTIITTNKSNPIPIDTKSVDRRYVVFQTTDVYLNKSSKFWTGLYSHFRRPTFMSALYQFFMDMDVENTNWIKGRPITQAYKDMCALYSPVEALFFEHFHDNQEWQNFDCNDETDEVTIPISELFRLYEQFCKVNRFLKDDTKAISTRSFLSRVMSDLEMPVYKSRTAHSKNVTFTPSVVYSHIYDRKWIQSYREEEEEEEDKGEDAPEGYFDDI
mgnify:CR=1 FL=1